MYDMITYRKDMKIHDSHDIEYDGCSVRIPLETPRLASIYKCKKCECEIVETVVGNWIDVSLIYPCEG